jgi:hypothetical protein
MDNLMGYFGLAGGGSSWAKNVLPVLGDLAGTWYSNEQSAKSAQAQMDFQERMSSTAYQRQMADMLKAGLNPILAGNSGGASTPGGASYDAKAPKFSETALGTMSQSQQRKFQAVQMDNIGQQTNTSRAAEEQAKANAQYLDRQMKLAEANTALTDQQRAQGAEIFREQLRKAAFDANTSGRQADLIDKQIEQIDQNMMINFPQEVLGRGAKLGLDTLTNPPTSARSYDTQLPYWLQSTGQPPEERNGAIPQHYLGMPR